MSDRVRFPGVALNDKRRCVLYLADFINIDGQRHFVSANVRTGAFKMERVSDAAIVQFVRNVFSIGEDGTLPNGRLPKASEVSA